MTYYAVKYENVDTGEKDVVFLQADNDAQAEVRFWDWMTSGYGCEWNPDATEVAGVYQMRAVA